MRLPFLYSSLLLLTIATFLTSGLLWCQAPAFPLPAADTTGKKLEILEAKRYNFKQIDSAGDFVSLAGNVKIRQGKTLFYCDSAVLDQKKNIVEAFGNIHINDDDSINTYSQYLKYFGREKDAILKNKVKLTDGKGVLTTNELHYNTLTKIGTYENGGKVVTGKTTLTSTQGVYYGETRDIYFKKKVVMVDPGFRITTDTLLYNTYTEIARFTVPTIIKNEQRTITTTEGYYDMKLKKAVFGKRPTINDKDYTLTADDIALDEASGFGDAMGSAIYKSKDTANPINIIANRLQSNNKTKALLATQKPVMIIKQGADTIYLAADTLYTAKLTDLEESRYVPNITDKDTAVVAAALLLPDTAAPANLKPVLGRNVNQPKISVVDALAPKVILVPGADTLAQTPSVAIDTLKETKAIKTVFDPMAMLQTQVKDTLAKPQPKPRASLFAAVEKRRSRLPIDSAGNIDSSRNRFVEAYFNVKIFSDSLQAVGDSLFYSFADSTFRLFKNPVIWTQDNQITGDTIYLFTGNKKPKRMYVFENALAINKVDKFYNQVKGNTLNSYFVDGNINTIKAKGAAENIYYAVDNSGRYIGVNRSTSDVIEMYFAERKPKKIVFINNLKGTTYPMNQVTHEELRLRGFKWLDDRRPKSKTDLFGK